MAYIELIDVDVDGCGTDVSTIVSVNTENITNGMVGRLTKAISDYKKEVSGEYDTDGCVKAVLAQLESEGFKADVVNTSATICF